MPLKFPPILASGKEIKTIHKSLSILSVLLLLSRPVMSDSLGPHGLQHATPLCPSPSPEVCPSSCPLHQWRHPVISSSETVFSFCLQSFPASGTFPMSQLFISDDQNIGVSASVLVLSTSIQGWFPLRLTSLISLLSKGLLVVNYNKDNCSNSQNLGRFTDSIKLLG